MGKKIPRVKQHDYNDCGAASLSCVAGYYGHHVPIARLRELAGTSRAGTTTTGLVAAAERLGFTARAVRGGPESLEGLPKPAIAHLATQRSQYHFVVLIHADRKHVRVMDPADGRIHRHPRQAFLEEWTGVVVLLAPLPTLQPTSRSTAPAVRFWQLLRPHTTVLAEALFGAVVYTVLSLSMAVYVQKVVDTLLGGGSRQFLTLMSVSMGVVLLAQTYVGAGRSLLSLRTGQKIDAQLVAAYYRHLMVLPQTFFDTRRVGEIISRVNDAIRIRAFINDALLELVANVLIVAFSFGAMFLYSPRLALTALAVVPLYGLIYFAANRFNQRNQRQLMERASELEAHLYESVATIRTIHRLNLRRAFTETLEARLAGYLQHARRSETAQVLTGSGAELLSRLAVVLVLWSGASLVLAERLTPGELISFYALVGFTSVPIIRLLTMNRTVQDALIAADRLFDILDLEVEDGRASIELDPDAAGEIRFEDVSFRFGQREPLFTGLNLAIPAGRMTALVGESGSGKSTLIGLLQRVYDPTAGRVTIGGFDLRHVTKDSLRRCVGVVPQEIDLFLGSVVENIAAGEREPDVRRVIEVCDSLGITGFIQRLPDGFHTLLSENGAMLSGGERQRIAIARAIYRNPRVLLLDEATSALDSASELAVRNALHTLQAAGTTIVVIAHRLSTVLGADHVVVLEKGKVAEQGTHDELLLRRGLYQEMWAQQFPMRLHAPLASPAGVS